MRTDVKLTLFTFLLTCLIITTSITILEVKNENLEVKNENLEEPVQVIALNDELPDRTTYKQTSSSSERYWVPFTSDTPKESSIAPKSRDTTGFCIDTDFFGMYVIKRTMDDGETYHQISIPSCGESRILGKPLVPQLIRYFEIPKDVECSVKTIYEQSISLTSYNIIPSQELHDDLVNDTQEYKFQKNMTLYETDAFFPAECVTFESEPIIIRGHRLLPVTFYPVRFNPVTNKLIAYSKIEVRVTYDKPAQLEKTPKRLLSPAFEQFLNMVVPNYQYRPDLPIIYPHEYSGQEITGCDYLIISYDSFADAVQPLAEWKQRKGYITKIVKTSEITDYTTNPTATDIYNYIKDAYDTWTPAPSFVLLVGDSQFIPVNYKTPHLSNAHGGYETPTDLYYFTVDGDDYFPDIYYGRLPVDTEDETKTIVSKILNYEMNPPNDSNFYSNIVAASYFQDGDGDGDSDSYEDRRFVLTAEEIRDYLKNYYTVNRVYSITAGAIPTNYSLDYDSGLPINEELLMNNGFAWDGSTDDIVDNITRGTFLVFHRDHAVSRNFWNHETSTWWSMRDTWGDPSFGNREITSLTNGDLLPVVLSVECQSCWFDSEVDQFIDGNLTRDADSICEAFIKQAGGGAIAAIGSTRNSKSGYNDYLMRGFIDAIWPEFDPAYNTGEIYHLGHMLNYGKFYMANVYGDTRKTKLTFELFHLMGDPELEMWTKKPIEFTVDFPKTIGSNSLQKFIIRVTDTASGTPVKHARVCLDQSGVHQVLYTNPSGEVMIEITPYSGTLSLTVTKHNYIPFLDDIEVTTSGAYVSISPEEGPTGISTTIEGLNFEEGELIDIYFGNTTTPSITFSANATGGFIIPGFTIPDGSTGFIEVTAVGVTSGRTAVTLFRRLPGVVLPDPYLYCQWAEDTWYLNDENDQNPRWNNPSITLYDKTTDDPVSSNDLKVGQTYKIKATIYNDEPAIADNAEITFEWAFWGAGQKIWNYIDSDKITVPAASGTTPGEATAEVDWTPSITGHVCLMVTIYHPLDADLDNNKGQENTHVQPAFSPAKVDFTLFNPSDKETLVYLEARRIDDDEGIWPLEIIREYPQVQKPGENKTVSVYVDVPDDVNEGTKQIFVINAYIDNELIGGIELTIVKGHKDTTTTTSTTSSSSTTAETSMNSSMTPSEATVGEKTTTKTVPDYFSEITSLHVPILAIIPLLYYFKKKRRT